MTWKKRIISIALCLCALLCAASVRAEAAGAATTHTDHPICGANHKDVGDHTSDNCSTPTWTAWNGGDITYDTNNVAYIYLSDDVTLEDAKPLTVSTNQTLYLCLNGHSIKMKYNGGYRVINVESGNLILCDCKGGGTITQDTGNKYKDRGVYVQKKYGETTPGTFTMYGGSITGNAGGVKIDSDCTFTMCSGNITANAVDSDRGGGVNVYDNGTFTMYNGEISHNSAYIGGGVYNGGKFTMSGGSITNNTAKGDGGGVEAVGNAVQITGGEITGNTATSNGGGVCFYNSDLTISSAAKVANNKAAKGGGVFFQGYTNSNTLTISDSAQITDNTAAENGGGIYISQNKNVRFLLSGSINISGNKKSVGENASTPNNVYLPSGYVITLTGKLTNTQKIGVTTENTPSASCISITARYYDNELVSAAKDKFTYENDSSYSIVTRSNGKVLAVCDHVYDTTKWSSDETNHYHKCKNCDTTKDTTAHSYSSDWKTDNSKHWHECVCGQKSGEAKHSYSTAWQRDDTSHFHECSACGDKKDITTCVYDQEDASSNYLVSAATCTAKAVYYKSCVCARAGTETFEYGEKNPNNHTGTLGGWQTNSDKHWKEYSCCQAQSDKAAHTWNEGAVTTPETCTTPGVKTLACVVCSATKTEEIHATGHAWDTEWSKDNDHHWHKCKNCDAITNLAAHDPGAAATETTPQLCNKCGYVIAPATHPNHTWVFVAETPAFCNATGVKEHYNCTCGRTSFKNSDAYDINADATVLTIEKNPTHHAGDIGEQWQSDSENHWKVYTCCGVEANVAAHSGGAATCTAKAVCQVCGRAYGPLAAHAWQPATCTAPKTCSVCHATDGAALGHDWGAWKVTTPTTKDAPGVETRTCTHDPAHTETRSIPKLSTAVYTVSEDTKIAQIEAKVDGLDKILDSEENKQLAKDGKSVGVSLTVKNTASSGVSEKIKEKLAGSNLVGLRLELTVEKTVTANGVVESKQTIPDTVELLKTTITLPTELQGKSGYVVYRLHGDAVHVLTETPNENGEFITVSADKTQITICARLYSEYVIAYQTGGSSGGGYHPVTPTPVKATSANTGDAGVLLYGVTAALSLTGAAWLGAKSRKH